MKISNIILETFFEDINNEEILSIWKVYLAIATLLLFTFFIFGAFSLGCSLIGNDVLLGGIFILLSLTILTVYIFKFIKTFIKLTK